MPVIRCLNQLNDEMLRSDEKLDQPSSKRDGRCSCGHGDTALGQEVFCAYFEVVHQVSYMIQNRPAHPDGLGDWAVSTQRFKQLIAQTCRVTPKLDTDPVSRVIDLSGPFLDPQRASQTQACLDQILYNQTEMIELHNEILLRQNV
jgi:hypothetical protein